jgi:hypothetical protein
VRADGQIWKPRVNASREGTSHEAAATRGVLLLPFPFSLPFFCFRFRRFSVLDLIFTILHPRFAEIAGRYNDSLF